MAVDALNKGTIDGVGLVRPLLSDLDYVNKLKDGQNVQSDLVWDVTTDASDAYYNQV